MSEDIEKEVAEKEAAEKEVAAEKSVPAEKEYKVRVSGDWRTFWIALLTAVIVVIIYHGIMYWFCGRKCSSREIPTQNIHLFHHKGSMDGCEMPNGGKKYKKFHENKHPEARQCRFEQGKAGGGERRRMVRHRRNHHQMRRNQNGECPGQDSGQ